MKSNEPSVDYICNVLKLVVVFICPATKINMSVEHNQASIRKGLSVVPVLPIPVRWEYAAVYFSIQNEVSCCRPTTLRTVILILAVAFLKNLNSAKFMLIDSQSIGNAIQSPYFILIDATIGKLWWHFALLGSFVEVSIPPPRRVALWQSYITHLGHVASSKHLWRWSLLSKSKRLNVPCRGVPGKLPLGKFIIAALPLSPSWRIGVHPCKN